MKSLSIIIPAYNEEKRIPNTIKEILLYMKGKNFEIIVVDDGSTDNTIEIVKKLKDPKIKILRNIKNRGKGFSVKRGMLNAKKEWALFMDADNATSIKEIKKFKAHTGKYDILIGSRNLKDSIIKIKQPLTRRILGKGFSIIVRVIMFTNIKDTQCGFKMFRKSIIKNIFKKQIINRWGFDVEILQIAKNKKYRIKEIPIIWINDEDSRLRTTSAIKGMLIELLKIRLNDIRGRY